MKMLQNIFGLYQKLVKENEKNWRKYCREDKIKKTKIGYNCKRKKEKINNTFFNYHFDYLNPEIMFKRLRDASDEKK